jgi:ribokinase
MMEPGGKGFNLAVGARRLGATVDGLLATGDDGFGEAAQDALAQADLPPTMLRRYAQKKTGAGVGFINAQGENCLAVYPGANLALSAADVAACAQQVSRASMTLAQFEIADAPIIEAFRTARACGTRTLLNPSPLRRLDQRLWESTSILIVNAIEAVQLTSAPEAGRASPIPATWDEASEIAGRLLARGPEMVVVTLGAGGALARQRGKSPLCQQAFPVDSVDTLGAGDAFTAGLAVSLDEGRTLEDSLCRACACGAMVSRKLGVLAALPTIDELERFLVTRALL